MTPNLLNYLCEPITKAPLQLVDAITSTDGMIQSGALLAPSGKRYPIINGIPRFVDYVPQKTVESFGDEWNHFNFIPSHKRTDNLCYPATTFRKH